MLGKKKSNKKKPKNKKDQNIVFEFQIAELLNPRDDYELFILSCFFALNDLTQVHKEIIKALMKNKINGHTRYLLRISIGHLREVYWFLANSFKNPAIEPRLANISKSADLYEKINRRVNGTGKDNFVFKVLKPSRNLMFHYGFEEPKDRNTCYQVYDEMKKDAISSKIILGPNNANNYYEFADEYFFSILVKNGREYGLDLNDLMSQMGMLTAETMELLDIITSDFLLERQIYMNKVNPNRNA